MNTDYSIIMPPPNITGVLHIGHVLNMTLQDVLIRRAKDSGKKTCWYPGLDHAAIATENKVIDDLKKKGINKSSLSRDEFLSYCCQWKDKYGGTILEQIKALNCSCDWDKITFTLDKKASDVVIDTFIRLYNDGLIYKSKKMINWDSQNKTALSDEEVIYRDTIGQLFYVKYNIADSDEHIVVATSRPETIFGDVAVCVNSNDERYKKYVGKTVIVPVINRQIPVIADDYVDKDFGTGCLKITPAHDFNDYSIGLKYNLEQINILNADGTLNSNCGVYDGLDRFIARKQISKDLDNAGLLIKVEQYKTRIGFSERSNTVIEPRLSEQWFVKMGDLAKPALDAVLKGDITFHPDRFVNIYRSWLENIKDWCISRQLWWGHRIPVYYYKDKMYAAHDINNALQYFKKDSPEITIEDIRQDDDVLDTWFSSALWPVIVTDCLQKPTDDLVTGPDIIFFWVARMIMMTIYLKKQIPFRNVYFTGIIRDAQGRKMSKSLGNSPDPLQLIDKYGSDGVRFGLLLSTQAGNDLKYEERLCKIGRNFITKIKNAHKLLMLWKERQDDAVAMTTTDKDAIESFKNKLQQAKTNVDEKFKEYKINEAAMVLYKLTWDDFCSIYLETIKKNFDEKMNSSVVNMSSVFFDEIMILLQPFIPETTEEMITE